MHGIDTLIKEFGSSSSEVLTSSSQETLEVFLDKGHWLLHCVFTKMAKLANSLAQLNIEFEC